MGQRTMPQGERMRWCHMQMVKTTDIQRQHQIAVV